MNTLLGILQRIKAALVGSSMKAQSARAVPVRVKLAGRNGYGNDDIPPPRS
jgi:hypothetical protein